MKNSLNHREHRGHGVKQKMFLFLKEFYSVFSVNSVVKDFSVFEKETA
jgi:hypothetical protein